MRRIAGGTFALSLHSLTGLVALLLMAVHAFWVTAVLACKQPKELHTFHRLSMAV